MRAPDWFKTPKLDDTQRGAVTGLGGGFMGAALTWAAALSLSSHPSPWRFAPPVVLFLAGAVLFVWALRRGSPVEIALDRRSGELERAIADGHAIQGMNRPVAIPKVWEEWHDATYDWLRRCWGLAVAEGFAEIIHERRGLGGRIAAQVAYLEGLRNRR